MSDVTDQVVTIKKIAAHCAAFALYNLMTFVMKLNPKIYH